MRKRVKNHTYSVWDVSHYIIRYSNERDYGVSNLKLQKLLYFVQAFFLINDHLPCFAEQIEAWDFGPVVPEIFEEYERYGGLDIPAITYHVRFAENLWDSERIYYDNSVITDKDKEMIRAVVDEFASFSATELVKLTLLQDPWINAYASACKMEIKPDAIKEYFSDDAMKAEKENGII